MSDPTSAPVEGPGTAAGIPTGIPTAIPAGIRTGIPAGADSSPDDSGATGRQFELRRGEARATVVALAGALRRYEVAGTALVESYGPDELPPAGCGIQLTPWTNRIRGGRWELDGAAQQLDLTEPGRGHAIHGLLRNTALQADAHSEHEVVLRGEIHPQHGYPFRLTHRVAYTLDDAGSLRVHQRLTNRGAHPAPVAFGAHPFLRLGDVPSEDLTLALPAATRIIADEGLIPTGSRPVEGTEDDFRAGRVLGTQLRDVAFADLAPAADGRIHHVLRAPDGRSVELWSEPTYAYVHLFVTDRVPGRSRAVAVEPMTAPGNALNSGEGLAWIGPGESLAATWGITGHLDAGTADAGAPTSAAAGSDTRGAGTVAP